MQRLAEPAVGAFYAAAGREFRIAAERRGVFEHDLRFADRRVRLRFAGADVADTLLAALAARAADDDGVVQVHASIAVWEESACPERAVPFPWRHADIGPGGLVRGSTGDRVLAIHEPASGALTLVDTQRRALLHRVRDYRAVPWWERAAPLRPALFWALGGNGRHLVHAGAVGDDRGGVLLAGASGSGKTTVALAALTHGIGYLADDYVLLHSNPTPTAYSLYNVVSVRAVVTATAHSLYRTAKLDGGHLERFPTLARTVRFPPESEAGEKAVLDVAAVMPEQVRAALPVAAVAVPRIRGGRARTRRVSAAEALRALAPSTVFQMPFDDGRVFASLAALVRSVPCFALDVGDDQAELAHAVAGILEEIAP
jgi:hypothetical protein